MKTTISAEGPKDKVILSIDNDDLNNFNYINLKVEDDNIELMVCLDELCAALEGFKKLRKNINKLNKEL